MVIGFIPKVGVRSVVRILPCERLDQWSVSSPVKGWVNGHCCSLAIDADVVVDRRHQQWSSSASAVVAMIVIIISRVVVVVSCRHDCYHHCHHRP